MTLRQRALVKGVASGKSVHRAALDAGYSPQTAKCDVYQNAKVRVAIAEIMDGMGLSDEALLQPIKDGLAANRRTRADHPIRLRASETGLRLRGYLGKEAAEGPSGPPAVSIVLQHIEQQADGTKRAMEIRIGGEGAPEEQQPHDGS